MPTPYGDLTTTQTWLTLAEEIKKKFPPEEITEVVVEMEDDDA